MKLTIKRITFDTKVYYSFTLIDIQFINTFQVVSINFTICNLFFQLLHEKRTK